MKCTHLCDFLSHSKRLIYLYRETILLFSNDVIEFSNTAIRSLSSTHTCVTWRDNAN